MFARCLVTLGATLMVSACAMTESPPPRDSGPYSPPSRGDDAEDRCGAGRVQDRVGLTYSESLGQALLQESGAGTLRVMRPGHAYTLEYRADRLNVRVDEAETITDIGCG
ncbi:I78 family peptidase inhibitor [Billgrantia gudaonensis]|uniref:Peptidase inhibitor I78 family protein n=1 Tax=Billgrantia gudaonensis TaxID=376427 RepID=A0A1G8Z415_9GAMM|nr:I78 family peptidase inhibitor [Halomonas gudaonensis]SDK09808.1 Peptidase inhibitor I78 family protein [Halomonas gudaonensis]